MCKSQTLSLMLTSQSDTAAPLSLQEVAGADATKEGVHHSVKLLVRAM